MLVGAEKTPVWSSMKTKSSAATTCSGEALQDAVDGAG